MFNKIDELLIFKLPLRLSHFFLFLFLNFVPYIMQNDS